MESAKVFTTAKAREGMYFLDALTLSWVYHVSTTQMTLLPWSVNTAFCPFCLNERETCQSKDLQNKKIVNTPCVRHDHVLEWKLATKFPCSYELVSNTYFSLACALKDPRRPAVDFWRDISCR